MAKNPYEFYQRRQRSASQKYGPGGYGPGENPVAPGSMTPDRAGQDAAMAGLTKAQQDSQFAEGMGQGIGSVAGAGLGALGFLIPGVGPVAGPALMAAGAGAGGMIGKGIGGAWGDGQEAKAQGAMDVQRRKALEQEALMQAIMGLRGI